jgi:hypothetical protein
LSQLYFSVFFSEIGQISPFSHFSNNNVFVGNQVQYPTAVQESKAAPPPASSRPIYTPRDVVRQPTNLTPDVVAPNVGSELYIQDEVYYPEDYSQEEVNDEEEVVFFYRK